MPQRIAKQIHELLLKSQCIRLIPHQNPDGDACGAVSALAEYLKTYHKKVEIFCISEVPKQLKFLAHMDTMTSDPILWNTPCDVIIVCDSGDPEYAGIGKYLKQNKSTPVVVIDHHVTNTHYGNINLVVTSNSSTCEILSEYFVTNQIPITASMATALLTGIIFDTGSFSNSATSKKSLAVASSLVKAGGSLKNVVKHLLVDKHINTLKLWGKALSNLHHDKELDIVYIKISLIDMLTSGVDEDGANGIANFMNTLKDGGIHIVFREKPDNTVKVSMRTTKNDIDVAQIAKSFGGGGHKKAAGFSLEGPIATAYEKIVPTLNKYLKKV